MTDYFALLDQLRSPWLDAEELKEAFHRKTLRSHPDARAQEDNSRNTEAAFSKLNEAYQVLRDPKRRLYHLLSLEGRAPSSAVTDIPSELEALFPVVAALTRKSDEIIQRLTTTTTALSRSLMRAELAGVETEVRGTLRRLSELHAAAMGEVKNLCETWTAEQLHALYLQFSYLTRWMAQLDEKRLALEKASLVEVREN